MFCLSLLPVFQSDASILELYSLITSQISVIPVFSNAEQTETFDANSIFLARTRLRKFVGSALQGEMTNILLETNGNDPHDLGSESARRRALKNTCLGFLLELENEETFEICLEQLRKGGNMTDEIAALSGLTNFKCPQRDIAIDFFYEKWKSDELVLDKWFVSQALSRLPNTLDRVKSLVEHEAFNIKNPNKVRALVGAFCHGNHHLFHSKDGNGYDFCAKQVIKLDSINPQIAARLARAFDSWRRIEGESRKDAESALQSISDYKDLSTDTLEIISRALGTYQN